MRDLHRHVVRQYAVQWERLGLELGLQDYDIANISENHAGHARRVEECCAAVLKQWLNSDPSATWGKLDDAIKKIKLSPVNSPVSNDEGGNHSYNLYKFTNTCSVTIVTLVMCSLTTTYSYHGDVFSSDYDVIQSC